jgi:hypothetical protein
MVALTTGFGFSPLTPGRKIVLLAIVAPIVGIAADIFISHARPVAYALAVVVGLAAAWAFLAVLSQQEGARSWLAALGIVLYAAAMAYALLSLRDDPLRAGAAALGLGVAFAAAAVISASIGFVLAGASVAASACALLVVWAVTGRPVRAGVLGTLTVGVLIALFAEGALMLARLPWYALAALLLVPLAVRLPVRASAPVPLRAIVLSGYALAAAVVPVVLAWIATPA